MEHGYDPAVTLNTSPVPSSRLLHSAQISTTLLGSTDLNRPIGGVVALPGVRGKFTPCLRWMQCKPTSLIVLAQVKIALYSNPKYLHQINTLPLLFQAHADSGFSSEYYDDSKDLLNALKKDSSWGRGFTFGIGPSDIPVTVDIGFHLSGGKGTLKNFTQYEAKVTYALAFSFLFC